MALLFASIEKIRDSDVGGVQNIKYLGIRFDNSLVGQDAARLGFFMYARTSLPHYTFKTVYGGVVEL